jgi:predicted DNA-binding ribbon-helix-helix protein
MMTIAGGSGILKRSVAIAGHRTSISVEEPFWDILREMAEREAISVQGLIARIDAERVNQNLSSAIRVFVVNFLRAEISRLAEPESAAEASAPRAE